MLSIRSKQMYRCIVLFAITSTCYAVVYQSDNCARFREKIDTPNFVKHQNTTYLPYSLPADYFGGPCPAPSYRLRNRLGTQRVAGEDRFGLIPFLEALNRVFVRVKLENPLLFSCIDGDIYHCRIPKGTSYYASHAFGAAIDIRIQSGDKWELDLLGDGRVMQGLLDLYPYMADEKLYWGAGFVCGEDAVHFEVSRELFITWQQSNVI